MPARVTLRVTQGNTAPRAFVFRDRATCIVGRDPACELCITDERQGTISRRHCMMDITPPTLRIRDLGSKNGTLVNGATIGQRTRRQRHDLPQAPSPDIELKDGDEVRVGDAVITVEITGPTLCSRCGGELPDDATRLSGVPEEVPVCAACARQPAARVGPRRAGGTVKGRCTSCGTELPAAAPGIEAPTLCPSCRANPGRLIARLVELARSGQSELQAIRGYEIERELGRGGMGAVYLARHIRSGERVALKVMLPRMALTQRASQLFMREVEVTRELKHRNVVELRDCGRSDGTFFFTLEYCEQGSVDRIMETAGGRLPLDQALPVTLDALEGLHFAHHAALNVKTADGSVRSVRGVIHRDLTPHNLFLTGTKRTRVTKIGDFGLAKSFDLAGLSGMTRSGAAGGKPILMPRQQVQNFRYARPDVDVWAAAACLYFMVTGRYPREFPRRCNPWRVVLETPTIPIRQRNSSIPAQLADLIDAALRDESDLLFKTAESFKQALEDCT